MPSCWLMKTEPNVYSIDDLKKDKKTPWDGVRNYQARNFMRDQMKPGDTVLIYHSNCDVPGIVGEGEVVSKPYPDPTAFDKKSKYFDEKSDQENPRWILIDVGYKKTYKQTASLQELKTLKEKFNYLDEFQLLKRGNRLSIMSVNSKVLNLIRKIGNSDD